MIPWVLKYFKFPVGHPNIHLACQEVPAMLAKEGIVRCTVLTTGDLYHLLLAYRCNGRLSFCLCSSCTESGFQEEGDHEKKSQRALAIKWFVAEVRVAIDRCCRVLKI